MKIEKLYLHSLLILMKEGVVDTSVVFEIANSLMDKLHENLNNDSTEIIDQLK